MIDRYSWCVVLLALSSCGGRERTCDELRTCISDGGLGDQQSSAEASSDAASEEVPPAIEPAPEGGPEPYADGGRGQGGADAEAEVLEASSRDSAVDAACAHRCDALCVDLATDTYNCGACGVQCIADGTHPAVPPGTCTAGYCLTVTPSTLSPLSVGMGIGNMAIANVYVSELTTGPNNYNASITWGDGAVTAGVLRGSSGGGYFQVLGSHTYYMSGSFSVAVTVNALKTSGTASTGFTITVN